ncbi:MAG: hypothetical protein QNK24_00170 [Desulfuromusa sp.]|nr:hypothetical protein [Desulfuromusa sp.]
MKKILDQSVAFGNAAFLPAADGSDNLMTMVVILLFLLMLVIGNFYLKLHQLAFLN